MPSDELSPEAVDFYRRSVQQLRDHGVPFLVGGAYAFTHYTGITRHTKDFDLFIPENYLDRAFEALGSQGYDAEITYPHWLAKVRCGEYFVDLIFRSGNGVSSVDEGWFERAANGEALGLPAKICAPEDIIWTKAFIQERERFDGADVAHLILKAEINWEVLLGHFGAHWRVLLAHLVLFGFTYPSERNRIPDWVMDELLRRVGTEHQRPLPEGKVCNGPLLSRAQYLVDIEEWGFMDGRLVSSISMSRQEVKAWTNAIDEGTLPGSSG